MIYCKNCNSKLPDEAICCCFCGAKIVKTDPDSIDNNTDDYQEFDVGESADYDCSKQEFKEPTNLKKSSSYHDLEDKSKFFSIAVIVVLVICFLGYKLKNKDANSTTSSSTSYSNVEDTRSQKPSNVYTENLNISQNWNYSVEAEVSFVEKKSVKTSDGNYYVEFKVDIKNGTDKQLYGLSGKLWVLDQNGKETKDILQPYMIKIEGGFILPGQTGRISNCRIDLDHNDKADMYLYSSDINKLDFWFVPNEISYYK